MVNVNNRSALRIDPTPKAEPFDTGKDLSVCVS